MYTRKHKIALMKHIERKNKENRNTMYAVCCTLIIAGGVLTTAVVQMVSNHTY